MADIVIIGVGNPQRSDDAAGWQAVMEAYPTLQDDNIEVLFRQELLPELAAPIARAVLVIFVDASVVVQPGEFREQRLEPEPAPARVFSHHMKPEALLRFARDLYQGEPEAWLITVGVSSLQAGTTLTPRVQAAMGEVVYQIHARITAFRHARANILGTPPGAAA